MSDKVGKYGCHFGKATYFSFLFMWLFIPYMVVQNLISDVESENGFGSLGFILLGIIYLFQCVGSILAPAIIAKFGMRKSVVAGGFGVSLAVLG